MVDSLRNQTLDAYEVVVVIDRENEDHRCDARNRGIEEARADLVALTDDDCAPASDWLATAVATFQEYPGVVLLEGPLDKWSPPPRHYVGANLAVRRSAALDVGGFDQRLCGYREDTEFGWRIEREYGVDACKYLRDWEVRHIGPLKSLSVEKNDMILRKEYPYRYFTLLRSRDGGPVARIVQALILLGYYVSPTLGEFLYKRQEAI